MNYSLKSYLNWIWTLTKDFRLRILVFFCLELVAILLSLTFVFWTKRAVDISLRHVTGNLKEALIVVVGSVVLGIIVSLLSSRINGSTRILLNIKLQNTLANSQMLSAWKYVKEWRTGDLLVRFNDDCREVTNMVVTQAPVFVATLIKLVASLGFLWVMDPMLVWMILAISPLFVFSKLYVKRTRKLNREMKEAESELSNVLQENLKLRMLIRGMGLISFRSAKLSKQQQRIYTLVMKNINFSLFTQGVMKMTMNSGYLLTFIWGIYKMHTAQISFGTMTAFLQLVGRVQGPLLSVMTFVPALVRFRTALDRVLVMLDAEKEEEEEDIVLSNPEAIHLRNIVFKYGDDTVIESLDAVVRKGEPTAIVGHSGKGKTTLIRLLLSLIEVDSGDIRIEDSGRTERLRVAHRINFAYVPQGNTLFSGTIRENILMDRSDVSDGEVQRVLITSCAEFVNSLPEGLDTRVGESGFGLSEGQAQRIAIARAILKDSPIWLLDEVTSALDQETAGRLLARLFEWGKDKIIVLVTHDLELADQCRQTIYMQ